MATIIKRGATVHACYRAESGAMLGSACRFKGTATVVRDREIAMTDQHGVPRRFPRGDVHHLDDCPYEPRAARGTR